MRIWRDDRGSAPVESLLVLVLLVTLVIGILQLALALHVRNTVHDAAAEGARHAALADSSLASGIALTRELIVTALGDHYGQSISAKQSTFAGYPVIEVTVRAPLPLIGLFGVSDGLEVTGRAAREPEVG